MTEQERFIQEMKNKFGDLVDLRICQNGDGGFMAWDAQVAFWAWQAAQQKEGYVTSATVREAVIAGWELSNEGHNNEYCSLNQSELNCMFDQTVEDVLKAAQEQT